MDTSVEIGQLLADIGELKKVDQAGPGRVFAAVAPSASAPSPSPGGNSLIPLKEQSPAPLRGSVKATQPTLRPDQVVDPGTIPVIATMIRTTREPEPALVPNDGGPARGAAASGFTGTDGSRTWQHLVEQVRREKIAIGSMLAETSFHAAAGSTISISCPDDFHAGELKRNRQYISAIAERLYGAKFQFESILSSMPRSGGAGATEPQSGTDRMKDSPLVRALVKEFGAEEIH